MDPVLKIILIILAVIIVLLFLSYLFGDAIIKRAFSRMDYNQNSELLSYDDVKNKYQREEFTFISKKVQLKGYIYGKSNNQILIYVHGMCPGHTGYLSDITYLVNLGYQVITYDYTATGFSNGAYFYGLNQQKYDLLSLFKYLQENDEYKNKDFYLYGHSMGGYAVAAVANKNEHIKKIVSISAFNKPMEILISFIKQNKKILGYLAFLPLHLASLFHFGLHYNENAANVLKKSNKNVLVIHGEKDQTVKLKHSIYNKKDKIKNDKISFKLMTEEYHNSHNSVIASTECVIYQKERKKIYDEELKKTKNKTLAYQKMIDGIDKFKFNIANDELMKEIDDYFKK